MRKVAAVNANSEHSLRSSRYQESDDGRVIFVSDKTGRVAKIDLRRMCPDGDFLTSPRKFWICSQIRDAIKRYAEDVSGAQMRIETLVGVVNDQFIWAYWLIDIEYPEGLPITRELLEDFLEKSATGLDSLIDARSKIWRAMESLEERYGISYLQSVRLGEIFETARVPFAWNSHLPGAALSIKQYIGGAKKIPQWNEVGKLKVSSLRRRAAAVVKLYPYLEDDDSDDFSSLVKLEGGVSEKTELIPSAVALRFLDKSVIWVVKIIPKVLEYAEAVERYKKKHHGKNSFELAEEKRRLLQVLNKALKDYLPRPIISCPKYAGAGQLHIGLVIRVLAPTACAIVIGAFTARRTGELESLRRGACIGDDATGYWIQTIIEKTLQRDDLTPCPRIVVEAVRLLEIMNADWYARTGDEYLFSVPFLSSEGASEFRFGKNMNRFADIVGVKKYSKGGRDLEWSYSPRQLRKLFAVMYVWRYDAGDISALSYHLRHFSIKTTLGYCRDPELSKEIAAQVSALTVKKLTDTAQGIVRLAGIYGKRLTSLVNRLLGTIRLTTERDVEKQLAQLANDRKIVLKATPWGYCGCSAAPSHLRRASCQRADNPSRAIDPEDGAPDATGSDETRCAGCLFFATDQTRAEWWDRACGEAESVVKDPRSARLQRVRYEKRLRVLASMRSAIGES
jgi:integrase